MKTIEIKDMAQVSRDKELMKIMQTGTAKDAESALRAIIARYKEPIFFYAFKFFKGNKIIAEDMVQEVFIKIWEKKHLYNHEMTFTTWMYNVALNNMIDEKRKDNVEVLSLNNLNMEYSNNDIESAGKTGFQIESKTPNPFELSVKEERSKRLLTVIDSIFEGEKNEKYKQVLTLFYFSEMDMDEVSKKLGIPVATVKVQLLRAKEKLRETLMKTSGKLFEGDITTYHLSLKQEAERIAAEKKAQAAEKKAKKKKTQAA